MSRQHGTYTKYVTDACRCAACRAANSTYKKERAARRAMEAWHPERSRYVEGDLVRAHLAMLSEAGMGWKRVARAAGVPESTVYPILCGAYPDRVGSREFRPPRKRVHRTTAEKILAVRVDLAPGAIVDGTGTARRLQALVTVGWSGSRLAARLGMTRANLGPVLHGTRGVTVATRDAVRALYDELWDAIPPAAAWRERQATSRARGLAARYGWAPPMAWDDETIDDPAAVPDLGEDERVTLIDEARELAALGYQLPEIAARLERDDKQLRDYLNRRGGRELAERITPESNRTRPGEAPIPYPTRHRKRVA